MEVLETTSEKIAQTYETKQTMNINITKTLLPLMNIRWDLLEVRILKKPFRWSLRSITTYRAISYSHRDSR